MAIAPSVDACPDKIARALLANARAVLETTEFAWAWRAARGEGGGWGEEDGDEQAEQEQDS